MIQELRITNYELRIRRGGGWRAVQIGAVMGWASADRQGRDDGF